MISRESTNVIISDNLLRGQVTREQFELLTPQVKHFWAFLCLHIINAKTFVDTMQSWQRLRPRIRYKTRCSLPLHSILCGSGSWSRCFVVLENVLALVTVVWQSVLVSFSSIYPKFFCFVFFNSAKLPSKILRNKNASIVISLHFTSSRWVTLFFRHTFVKKGIFSPYN